MEGVFSACSSGNIDLVKGLIDGGVSPLVRDDQQNTLLHVCCASDPCRLDLLQYLLFLIKPLNVSQLRNANGSIPLHLACTNGNNDVVQFLVPRYCDFSDFLIPDNEHKTSLYIACENGYTDIVSYACAGIDKCIDEISQYLAISANWSITLSLLKKITLDDYIALVNTVKCAILSQAAPTNNFCIQLKYTNTTFLHLVAISGDIDLLQYLVNDMSWDVNCFDEDSYTPVHLAISKSCVSTAKFLVSVPHCKCETMNIHRQYPIHDAVQQNQLEIVKALVVHRKCDVNVRTIHGYTPLHCACENGSFEIFSLLATHPQCETLEAENDDKKRPLHIACQSGNVAIVHHLVVQMQCDINIFDKRRNTPLHYACGAFSRRDSVFKNTNTGNIEIFKLLSNHSQCKVLEAENDDMKRPLHIACQSGNVAIVHHLVVQMQCDINIFDKSRNTPLHYACGAFNERRDLVFKNTGNIEIVKLLSNHSQCKVLEAENDHMERPIHIACQSTNVAIVHHLVDKKCQINIKGKYGNTPLHYACQESNFEIFSLLATHPKCETLEVENDDMKRPLHIACQSGNLAIVHHLVVQMQCDINIFDKSRNTPLHYACKAVNERRDLVITNTNTGNIEIVKLLSNHSQCKVLEAENDDMKRPLHIACQSGNVAIVHNLVVQMQCDINIFDKSRNTPLHYACGAVNERRDLVITNTNTGNIEIVKLLSNHSQCKVLEAENDDMKRPLHIACQSGNVVIVHHLVVQMQCDINIFDKSRNTPLHYACGAVNERRDLVFKNTGNIEIVKLLSNHSQCKVLEAENDDMERPLHIACQSGNVVIVHHLVVQMQCDINIFDKSRNTPLHYACGAFNERRDLVFKNTGNIEIVKLLSNHSQCKVLEAENDHMERPLHIACQSTSLAIVRYLVHKKCQINIKGKYGNTPLHYACQKSNFEIFSLLATHPQCETLEVENDDMERPLHIACQSGNLAIVQHLIDKNCEINIKGKSQNTPLHYACQKSNFEIFSLLATHPKCETLEVENDDMKRPLHIACQSANVAVVHHLVVQMQCEINIFDKSRNTPLHYACGAINERRDLVITNTGNIEIVKLLSNHSQCKVLEAENDHMERPLHIACQSTSLAIVRYLVHKKCQINIKGKYGNTPLHYACQKSNFEIFSLLATHPQCETLEVENDDMERPLHIACQSGNLAIVQHLIDKNCEINIKGKSQNTPLHYACQKSNFEIFSLLATHPQCETLEAENDDKKRPLHIACQSGNVAIVHHLVVQMQCDINIFDKRRNTPLHYACGAFSRRDSVFKNTNTGSIEIFKLLSNHSQCKVLEAENDDMKRPLHIACQSGNVAIVHHLVVQMQCDINIFDKSRNTPLHYACGAFNERRDLVFKNTGNIEIVKLLSNHSQCKVLEAENDHMERPLHIACQSTNVAIVHHLVDKKCQINIKGKYGNTPLHYACQESNFEIFSLLATHPKCETLEVENDDMKRPLHIACQSGNLAIVHHLVVQMQCDINIFDKSRNTPLHYACKAVNERRDLVITNTNTGNIEIVKLLSNHSQCKVLEAENDDMERPLHIACQSGNVAIVHHLVVQMQCDINIFDKSRNTPLHYACGAVNERRDLVITNTNTGNIEIVKLLSNHSQCKVLEAENDDMKRPLHIACQSGNVVIVHHLVVQMQCDINIFDKSRNTPLHYACGAVNERRDLVITNTNTGNIEIVKLLSNHSQCKVLEAENDDMKRPLHIACQSGNVVIVHHLVVQMQCDINIFDKSRNTPLHYACGAVNERRDLVITNTNTGNIEIVKLLSNHSQCKVLEAENDDMKRPLHIACQSGNVVIVHHLVVQMQCDINIFDKSRNTPLHYACGAVNERRDLVITNTNTGNIEIVKLLSNHSQCKVLEAENDDMKRPLHIACQSGNVVIVHHLVVQMQCDINIFDKSRNTPLHYACGAVNERRDLVITITNTGNIEIVKLLSNHSQCKILEAENDDMKRPLHIACQSGNVAIVHHLVVQMQCDINIFDKSRNTPLHYACGAVNERRDLVFKNTGNIEIVKLLSNHSQCKVLEAENDDMERPLHIACQSGNVVIVHHLVVQMQCDINIFDKSRNTPLHYACGAFNERRDLVFKNTGNIEIVKLLSNHSQCKVLEAENDHMERPIHIACQSTNVAIVHHLVDKKCQINIKGKYGNTPLHYACQESNFEIFSLLATHPKCETLEVENDDMERPLHIACQSANVAVVHHLVVQMQCEINIFDKSRNTPLHYACGAINERRDLVITNTGNIEIVKLLSNHSQCKVLEAENDHMERPLHIACQSTNVAIVHHLVDKKCQINIKGKYGNTPLHYACQKSNFEIFSLLATHPQCETLEVENDDMERPLHIACQSGNLAIVQHLIDKNCEINIKGKSQNTPLHYACQKSNFEIFSLLATHPHCETLEAENDDMERPLHIACQFGNVKIIHHLVINKRCNIDAKNWNGDDPLQCAIDHANFSAVNFLCKYFPNRSLEKCNFLPHFSKFNSFFEAVSSNGMVKLKIVKCILTGPPGSGKSTLKKKLLNESLTESSLSTGVVDAAVQIPIYRKLQQHNAVIPTTEEDNTEWKNQDLEEETFLLNTCLQKIQPSHILFEKVIHNIDNMIHEKLYYSEASFHELERNIYSVNFENKTNDGTVDNNDISSRAKGTVSLLKLASSASNAKRMQYRQKFMNKEDSSCVMLHIIDTGGQPEFHEMLPALVTGPAINLLVFKLNEDLRSCCNITCRSEHGNSLPYPTSLTHEEVILRTLASIACLRQNALGWSESVDKDESEPAAFLIATHRDCVQESDVAEVNERLKQLIKSSSHLFEETLIQFANQEQVIFPLDTVNDVAEIEELRCRLEEVASKNFSELLIPASWCAFSVRLRRRQESFHQLSYCYRVAKECGIKDTAEFLSVLWYLHHRVGHIMYYPEVEGLKDVVITNLQLIFDCTTELVTSCFTFKQFKHPSVYERFAKNGKFLESDLEKVSLKESGAPFSSKTLVSLLKHLYIVAGPFASDNGNCYFMPCALKPAAVNDLVRDESSIGPVPLLIYFECGYTPVGVFCCLVIYLLSQTSSQWILIDKPQNCNKITFKIHKTHDKVTLISRATYLEVWVDRIPGLISPVSDDSLCGQVLSTIQSGILTVVQSLNYTYKSKHLFGFHCTCCSSSSPHPALIDELGVAAVCVFNNDDVMPLNGSHMMWSKKVCNQYFMLMIFICLFR